jgi:EmrB/QacA subfamily drug resistance transporter
VTGAASVIPRASDECALCTAANSGQVAPAAGGWVLAATILGSSIAFIDGSVVNVALPIMQRSFHATAADLQWVIEAYSLFLSALILVGGSLGDRLGRRRIFAFGIAIFTIASVACGAAPNIGVLIVARCIQGVGGACLVPGSLAIISAAFDTDSRGKAIGTWAGFTTITSALGPVLGGWLVQHASWRWVFFINVPLAAITLFLLYRHVPESRDEQQRGRLDWLGALCITGGLGGIVFGLIEAGPLGFGDPVVLGSLVGGIVLVVVFVYVEAHSAAPMMPLDVFRSRTFTGTNLLTLFLYGGLGGSLYFFPFDLQQVQGYSPTAAGAAFLPFTLIIFVMSRWTGGLVQQYGAKLPLIVGPIVTGVGFLLFIVPDIGGSYWTTFFPAVVVMSVGMAVVIAPLTTAVMNAVETHRSGVASGVNNAVSRAAGLLAIAVLGLVVTSTFNASLDSHLNSLQVPPQVRSAVEAQRTKLAGATLPPGGSATQNVQLEHALKESFVSGFRAAMFGAAVLALGSAFLAAWLIEGKKPQPQEETQVA